MIILNKQFGQLQRNILGNVTFGGKTYTELDVQVREIYRFKEIQEINRNDWRIIGNSWELT